ncbi:alpha-E domain-containing protein [Aliarcobacter butzleri]|uniref:alpha-E domain-containing protein n=1 Tax=Aliarcobacter butzleri TaxID=28197 RepID=UPI00102DCDE4|nr:alpha-E domain-containing protein [Aliarcobacter butzleri]MCG3678574.1 alpha-E domain-containing protein [Aliarcobacter butzleri]MDN5043983.1 alpha-E domain-containing protein [Aliarcobacter butzleri]MDN5049504.1 alpha-E domain-containing protein [Aliarcobacter butzleri]MDN5056301.1 alpha-E domain-containing protein [Aliarcobacter butzleri]MDN5111782.1 alpha-E domain-containing protein [Aliarcobacter butzleri]
MEQLLTTNVANNLYWFGRYLERVEATLIETLFHFDKIVDIDKDSGKKFYKKLGIDIEYANAKDFLKESIFGKHDANIYKLISYAKENAIISRSNIDTEAFGSVIELADLLKHSSHANFSIDCRFIEYILSLISQIWGELTRREKRDTSDYFIRLGKFVEKVDFHLRVGNDKEFSLVVIEEIDKIATILAPNAKFKTYDENDTYEAILNSVNSKINKIIVEEE